MPKTSLLSTRLMFPWGPVCVESALASGRCSAYMEWLHRQPEGDRLRLLNRLTSDNPSPYRPRYYRAAYLSKLSNLPEVEL